MDYIIYFILWYLIGFVSFLIAEKYFEGFVTVREFLRGFYFALAGPFVLLVAIFAYFVEKITLDKKLF